MPRMKRLEKVNTKDKTIKKLRETLKALRKKLAEKTSVFKQQLKTVKADTHAAAVRQIIQEMARKNSAKLKVLEAASEKFEKKYAKKMAKKSPEFLAASPKHAPAAKTSPKGKKRRGRLPKNA